MRNRFRWLFAAAALAAAAPLSGALAGDSLFGTVSAVRSADTMVFDAGKDNYVVHLAGIDAPREGPAAKSAEKFVSGLVLGKPVRLRLDHRTADGVLIVRLFTAEKSAGIRDVAVELLKAGLARRQAGYDEKYGELAAAEKQAQRERRGIWSSVRPQ